MKEVTRDDIDGLRVDTRALSESVDKLAERQKATDEVVDGKADTSDVDDLAAVVAENRRLAWRANLNSTIAVVAMALALFIGGLFLFAQHKQHDKDATITHDRRAADCAAVADFGDLVKQGITVISVPADRQASLDSFVQQYDAAIDAGVVKVRVKKGYSPDCTVIGNPPKTGG